MRSDGYSVRPPPPRESRRQERPEDDDDYYFLQFGSPSSPSSRYDEPRGYYDEEEKKYDDDDYDGPQPGAPRPAFVKPEDESPKGPPSSFGNFVADASMSKTGYAPTSLKDETAGGNDINGNNFDGEEFGEEMSYGTGGMLRPKGVNGSGGGRASSQGRSDKPSFVVSEDQDDGGGERNMGTSSSDRGGGRKKGPPSSFGKAVSSAGEHSTGHAAEKSIEEIIASGGMSTPTGNMAKPKRQAPANPAVGDGNPAAPSGGTGRATGKKALFIVSEDDAGTPDFGSTVAEASGSRTGWAPKTPKRATGSIDGGTTGGMTPKLNKPSNQQGAPQKPPQKKEFGSGVFDDCPPLDATKKRKPEGDRPLTRKQVIHTETNQKHQRNPAVNLVDGGASKDPPKQVQFSGSMMAPRIRHTEPPAKPTAPPTKAEGVVADNPEDEEKLK